MSADVCFFKRPSVFFRVRLSAERSYSYTQVVYTRNPKQTYSHLRAKKSHKRARLHLHAGMDVCTAHRALRRLQLSVAVITAALMSATIEQH